MTQLLDLDINGFDLDQPFNIGIQCTQPSIEGFDSQAPAIIVDHFERGSSELSFDALNQQSNRFAHALKSLGINKGDRVMLWLPNVEEFPISFFGTLKLGAIAVPSSTLLAPDEVEFIANNAGARCLVTTAERLATLSSIELSKTNIEHVVIIDSEEEANQPSIQPKHFKELLQNSSNEDLDCTTLANDPAYLVYTSGTTGYPKGVLHAHRAVLGRLPAAKEWFDYSTERPDRILHSGKFNWTYVLGTALMDPLLLGKTVIVFEGPSHPTTWPALIAKHDATIFIGVPTIYRQILEKTEFTHADVPSLRHCMCAGEQLSDQILSAWQARFEQNIYEAIGMSECSYYLSQHPSRPVKAGSAGMPQKGHKIALLNDELEPVETDEEGMLCIHQDDVGLFIEYWNLPEETAKSRKQGYFLTGDYARRDEDGYIWFLGRKDDIINTFGYRVSPMEIERVLKTHPDIADCVALQEEVAKDKHIVTLCTIMNAGSTATEAELIHYASEHLAKYKLPRRVVFMESFPRTRNGKVLRKALKTQLYRTEATHSSSPSISPAS